MRCNFKFSFLFIFRKENSYLCREVNPRLSADDKGDNEVKAGLCTNLLALNLQLSKSLARWTSDEGCATVISSKAPLPQSDVGRIAPYVREEEGRKEKYGVVHTVYIYLYLYIVDLGVTVSDHEIAGSFPSTSIILDDDQIWNGVHPASWEQLGSTCLRSSGSN